MCVVRSRIGRACCLWRHGVKVAYYLGVIFVIYLDKSVKFIVVIYPRYDMLYIDVPRAGYPNYMKSSLPLN